MVSLKSGDILDPSGSGKMLAIEKWEVWFQTPFGLINDFKEAKQRVESADLDPDSTIVPVPVAISGGVYEIVVRL
jgi:hypothetical protein